MIAFPMVPTPRPDRVCWLPLLLAALLPLWLDSCTSTHSQMTGVPDTLPDIALAGTAATPPHHMANYEYPFNDQGDYVSDWAADGERHFGRAAASSEDEEKWSNSHGGKATGPSKVGQKKKVVHEEEHHTKSHKNSDKSEDKPKKTSKKSTSDKSESKPKSKSTKSEHDDDKPKKKTSSSSKKSDSSEKTSTKSKSSTTKKSGENTKKSND